MRGVPERQESSEASRDEATAARLWDRSAELTGVTDDVETLAGENLSRATEAGSTGQVYSLLSRNVRR
jgi:hypothetical protein